MTRRRIAVVGSGVAGITAAYVLQHAADVTLFEAADRLGGHADTHEVLGADGRLRNIDTGFIVHNLRTYPMLRRLFGELGVATQESDMSMSISCAGCGLEYAGGRGFAGLLASRRSVTNPRYLRMLREVVRFHDRAHGVAGQRRPPADGPRVHRGGSVLALLHRALHDAGDRRRVVHRPDPGRRLPGPLPVRVPAQPRRAQRHRQPGLVHGGRRVRPLRRARGEGPDGRADVGARPVDRAPRVRRRDPRRRRHRGVLRRRRRRHPPAPGAAAADDADPARAPVARGDRLHRQPDPPAHRHLGAAARAERAAGVVELRHARRATRSRPPFRSATT